MAAIAARGSAADLAGVLEMVLALDVVDTAARVWTEAGTTFPIGPDGTPLTPSGFDAMFSAAAVLIGIGFVVVIVLMVRNAGHLVKRGIDPTTVDAEMTARLLNSPLLAPQAAAARPRSIQERLAELDRLLSSGTISDDEHSAARAEVLRDV